MIVVKACFDESGKLADQDCVVFAGSVATEDEWGVISTRWNAALNENDIRYLSMKEAIAFSGEFKNWRKRVVERDRLLDYLATMAHPFIGFYSSAAMKTKDFLELPEKQRAKLKNLQYCGFEGCVRETIRGIKNQEMKVQLWCDSSDEYARQCLDLYIKLRRENQDVRDKCIAITFAEDEHFPPLQFADMVAYAVRHSQPDSTPEPIIQKLMAIFSKDGVGKSGLIYQENGKGLGSGKLEPMRIKQRGVVRS